MEYELDQYYTQQPAIDSMDNNEFQRDWLNPFLRFCQEHGLEMRLFNIRKIEKEFKLGNVLTWHQIMSKKPQSENERRLFEFDPILLKHHRLHELCKQYPSQLYDNLIETLIIRRVHLLKERSAIFTQEYGNMFEIKWRKAAHKAQNLWKIAVSGSYQPPNIEEKFPKSDCTIYFCKPFGDILIKDLGTMKDNGAMVKIHSHGQAMLLHNSDGKLGGRPMLSILSLEVQNQLSNSTLSFLDIENGVAMWVKASSKITKPLFFIPPLKKQCTI